MSNQNPEIGGHTTQWPKKKGQTTQWPKKKGQKEKQRSTKQWGP